MIAETTATRDGIGRITEIICRVGSLSGVGPDDDIYDAGFSSIHALQLLIELEDAYGVTLEDDRFITTRTPRAFHSLVAGLQGEQGA